jgi:hypothetical protein
MTRFLRSAAVTRLDVADLGGEGGQRSVREGAGSQPQYDSNHWRLYAGSYST